MSAYSWGLEISRRSIYRFSYHILSDSTILLVGQLISKRILYNIPIRGKSFLFWNDYVYINYEEIITTILSLYFVNHI